MYINVCNVLHILKHSLSHTMLTEIYIYLYGTPKKPVISTTMKSHTHTHTR